MSNDIVSVLFIPNEDNASLLDEGPCGYRPPTAEIVQGADSGEEDEGFWDYECWHPGPRSNWQAMAAEYGTAYKRALVLAWEGIILGVGCDLLDRQDASALVYGLMHKVVGPDDPRLRGMKKKGTFVFLDKDRKEFNPASPTNCSCYIGCEEDDDWHQHRDDPCPVHPNRAVK